MVKKTRLAEYNTPLKADGIIAINLRENDELIGVRHSTGEDDVLMVSRSGQAIRFHERAARPMGRATAGVQGMRLRKDDEVIELAVAGDTDDLLVVTEQGYGKRTPVHEYPRKGRGGLGVKTIQLTDAKGKLAGARVVRDGYQLMLISTGGTVIRMSVDEIKRLGRATQGVIVVRLRDGEKVSSLAPVAESEDVADTDDLADPVDVAEPGDGAEVAADSGRRRCRLGRRRSERTRAALAPMSGNRIEARASSGTDALHMRRADVIDKRPRVTACRSKGMLVWRSAGRWTSSNR